MKKISDYLLLWVLVMITLPFIFVSEVEALDVSSKQFENYVFYDNNVTYDWSGVCSTGQDLPYQTRYIDNILYNGYSMWLGVSSTYFNFDSKCFPHQGIHRFQETDNNGVVQFGVDSYYTENWQFHFSRSSLQNIYNYQLAGCNMSTFEGCVSLPNDSYIRADFLLQVALQDYGNSGDIIDWTAGKQILDYFISDPVYNQCDVKFGYKGFDNLLAVSCLVGPNEDLYFVLTNRNKSFIPSAYNNRTTPVDFYFNAWMSEPELVFSDVVTGLISNGSLGSDFNFNYQILEKNGGFFTSFNTSSFNGLTSIITSPLALISRLRTDSQANLAFSIFGKEIILPSGQTLFWNRPQAKFNTVKIGSYTCNARCGRSLITNFRSFWGNIFGGFLLYLTLKKLFQVCLSLVDPSRDEVKTL